MEEVEVTFVVGAIGWLVQTILESLFSGKLEAWIRGVGLADDIEKLRSEIERVEMVVAAVKGRAIGNKPLARSLARLKELLYDADDAIDNLDYYRLQQQVQPQGVAWHDTDGTDGHGAGQVERPRGNADISNSSRGKKRSKAWKDFKITEEVNGKPVKAKCIHCHTEVKCGSDKGTSVLHNHLKSDGCQKKRGASDQEPNTSSAADGTANGTLVAVGDSSSRKRMRMHEESTHNTSANAHPWNKAEFSNRIRQITRQLQDITGAVREVLKLHGSDSVASSNHYWSTRSDVCPGTSSLNQRKIYGRDAEKNSIIKMITADIYDDTTVLPIVGIGGVGKTALAQHVYDNPTVKSQFERIWVWVSNNFDEVRLTREMLDFVSQKRHEGSPQEKERHAGISSFAKLQEILKGHMGFQSKRFLLILDDVWDNMDSYQWNKLLTPLKSDNAKGNVILVTTRNLSVAKKIGTIEPIKVAALENKDFWLLFKACAFNDENYEGHPSLNIIGQQIAEKLQGNPLAAETAGVLLREHLTIDHWSNILKNQEWKSLQLSRGIMPALKLSYDQLPYHLQQCFLYCCIFPKNYQFVSEELIRIWIAQGFVNGVHSSKRLEEIGQDYLFDLVNSGFFQQTKREVSFLGNQTCYVMCGLMHDFAMAVSRTECATIDGLQCNQMLPTVHHLSIVTDSAYSEDQHANKLRNEEFEKKLLNVVTSVRRLRTLVLIGQYDASFFQLFQNLFKEARNLRVLQISENCADFNSFMCNVANPTHLRYLKLEAGKEDVSLPQVLSKYCHLQVLAVGSNTDLTISTGVNNLISLRHLVAEGGACSFIVSNCKMTSLQELHNFRVENSSGFEIKQLQSMNELVQLGVSQLENVKTREEAYEAGLTNKQHLEKLHLSWNNTLSQDEYDSDMSSEISTDIETEEESSPMDDSGPSSEPSRDTAREVLEGLEPHHNLKHLRISGYDGATSPEWLATSLTSLQTLHLECCGKWRILPSLERLLFLRKLELRNMRKVTEVLLPSLEELVLIKMPKLERCSCTSERDLNSSLRVLKIKRCPVLKVFPLFGSSQKFKIEQKSWLSSLGELIIHECPQLLVPHPLPPSTSVSKLSISRVSTLPTMEGSSSGTLTIGASEYSNELRTLDGKMLSFQNLRFLTHLIIAGCQNLTSISFKGLSQLISLKSLEIAYCEELFSSHEDMAAADCNALPSLERLCIESCGITGKWLSVMLRHVQALEELILEDCPPMVEEEENSPVLFSEEENSPVLFSEEDCPSSAYPNDELIRSAPEGLLCIPLNVISSLKKISIKECPDLTFYGSKDGFAGFTSLVELYISGCPKLLPSSVHKDGNDEQANGRWLLPQSLGELSIIGDCPETLQPCFPENLTCLKKLEVKRSPSLKSLQLHSCTALEELEIEGSGSFISLEGLQFLGSLRLLRASRCLGDHEQDGRWLLPQSLGELQIEGKTPETLQPCFPENLTCLKKLKCGNPSLKSLQLHSCTALEELEIEGSGSFISLEGLQFLGSLRLLRASRCLGDHEQDGRWLLPQSLGELQIEGKTPETLQPCFPENLTCLKKLEVKRSPSLKSLQLHSCTALEELEIEGSGSFISLEGLQFLGSLRLLRASRCLGDHEQDGRWLLPQSLGELQIEGKTPETLQPCFPENLTCLKKLKCGNPSLKSLQLHSCTSLEELAILYCVSLDSIEGLQSLGALRHLKVTGCPRIICQPELLCLCPRLETLEIDDPSALTSSFCKHLTSLQQLRYTQQLHFTSLQQLRKGTRLTDEQERALHYCLGKGTSLTDEQERALQLLASLKELQFCCCSNLVDLPAGLHSLPNLKRLSIHYCYGISRLPEKGLPPPLEELQISDCREQLTDQCRKLATSKLKVKIDGKYVN